ncbi:uncharacterized protein LOC142616293 [Castanea sativa]|uniref:uncharacterized protein LOC142616293 n=1 Tax=Castanea sativa TaxID=21020 RepID=UPI003F64CFFD
METPNLVAGNPVPIINNPVPNPEVINSVPISSSCLANLPDFEIQIQEIDTAIMKFDHQISAPILETAGSPHLLVPHEYELQITEETNEANTQDLYPHVADSSHALNSETNTLRKWKKLACDIHMMTDQTSFNTATKRGREAENDAQPELPLKKLQVSREDAQELLGNLHTEKELEVLIRAKDPSIVFLAKTWADETRLKDIQQSIKFDNLFFIERHSRAGGLALYWKNSLDLHIDSFSKYHIDSIINKGNDEAWHFTGFYREPVTNRRSEAWNRLKQLNSRIKLPWLCAGDFNELTRASEKMGGSNRNQSQMQLFREIIGDCGFIDLSFVGSPFTWRKHSADGHFIWERLDRGLANNDWFLKFLGLKVHHLHSDTSDHSPLWITPDGLNLPSFAKPFRFEEMWLSDRGCSKIVEVVWCSDDERSDVAVMVTNKIKKCGKELSWWNRTYFDNVRQELAKKRKELIEAKKVAMQSGCNQRRVITDDMNRQLSVEFSKWEVKQAINQMAPLKAPGPVGLPLLFYQHYWNLIGDDISNSDLHFLNSTSLPENLNHTFITVIPKKKNPESAADFKPISLYNVLYKIFSKVLANRLKKILPHIIVEQQSAFTKSRLSSDNILVAFEYLHSMHNHKGNENFMEIKLDINKAYNMVE